MEVDNGMNESNSIGAECQLDFKGRQIMNVVIQPTEYGAVPTIYPEGNPQEAPGNCYKVSADNVSDVVFVPKGDLGVEEAIAVADRSIVFVVSGYGAAFDIPTRLLSTLEIYPITGFLPYKDGILFWSFTNLCKVERDGSISYSVRLASDSLEVLQVDEGGSVSFSAWKNGQSVNGSIRLSDIHSPNKVLDR